MKLPPHIKAVCFDAFGTLVEIEDKRRSHAKLLSLIDSPSREKLKHVIMREPLSLDDCVAQYAPNLPKDAIYDLKTDLHAELTSISRRPKIDFLWRTLIDDGYKIGLCSNLALSYGPPLLDKLPSQADALILSYETGYIKPEPQIYQRVCDRLSLPANAILFTGDTQAADIDGPIEFGMNAIHIDELLSQL